MSKKVTDLPAATSVEAGDKFLIVDATDGLSKQADASLVGGAPSGGTLIARWNGIDVSQFDIANAWVDDDASNGRITGMGMTAVVDGSEMYDNTLVMEPTGYSGGADGSGIILANDPIPDSGQFAIELDILDHDVNTFCVVFAANDPGATPQADLFCFAVGVVGSTFSWMLENGEGKGGGPPGYGGPAAPCLAANQVGTVRVVVNLRRPGTGNPRGRVRGIGARDGISPRSMITKVHDVSDWPDAPPSSAWDALTLNRWGFGQYAAGGSTAGPTRIADWRLYDLS